MSTIQPQSTCFVESGSTRVLIEDGTLLEYMDGALDEDDRTGVSDHLARCASCRQRLTHLEGRVDRLSLLLETADSAPAGSVRGQPAASLQVGRASPYANNYLSSEVGYTSESICFDVQSSSC